MATRRNDTGVRITLDRMRELKEDLRLLASVEVLVGVPAANTERDEPGEPTNATLAYIHDNGAPEANIPARPFMQPGIESVREQVTDKLAQTMRATLRGGGPDKIEQGLVQVGTIAAVGIQMYINEGVAPPLSERTLKERLKKKRRGGGGARKGAQIELDRRAAGEVPSVEFAKPLVDLGDMRDSITYAIRKRSQRRR